MKEGYIPREQRKRILLLCDDIRVHSGVANVGREIATNTAHRFNWFNLGAAVQHPDEGKRFDVSSEINTQLGIEDANVVIQCNNGYGNPDQIRKLIKTEKIDAIFLITDPRYFMWLFQIENEIRKEIPIAYLNIWDNYPAPMYNRPFYESCDALFGISKQTVNINRLVLGEKLNNKILKYVPHGLDADTFKPIDTNLKDYKDFKTQIGIKEDDFVVFYNSRNIRRKQIPDTLLAFKYFKDQLPQEKQSKVKLLLHTEIVSDHGTDLMAVKNYLFGEDDTSILFSTSKLSRDQLNYLYNLADVQILLTSNEGWGLSLTEAILAGTPIIANVTGGMQDQMRFVNEEGNWIDFDKEFQSNHKAKYKECGDWAKPVFPSNISLVGTVPTPYIYDDRCSPEDVAEAINYWYSMNKSERKKRGQLGRKWVTSKESGMSSKNMCNNFVNSINKLFN